jgi:U3 small nucleolar RNA-associated protein 25
MVRRQQKRKHPGKDWARVNEDPSADDNDINERAASSMPLSKRNVPTERDVAREAQRASKARERTNTNAFRVAKRDSAKLSAYSTLLSKLSAKERRVEKRQVDDDDEDEEEIVEEEDNDQFDDGDEINADEYEQALQENQVDDADDNDDDNDDDDEDDEDNNDEDGDDIDSNFSGIDRFSAHFQVESLEDPRDEHGASPSHPWRTVASPGAAWTIECNSDTAQWTPAPDGASLSDCMYVQRRVAALLAEDGPTSREQLDFAQLIGSYNDVLFAARTPDNAAALRTVMCAHVISHMFKTREVQVANNKLLETDPTADVRDAGFTRPKVLIVAPHRRTAFEIVSELIRLYPANRILNAGRLEDEYGDSDFIDSARFQSKPADFRETFRGNSDDSFRIGIRMTTTTLRLFADFYTSDLIVASPLGMRLLFEQGQTDAAKAKARKRAGDDSAPKKRGKPGDWDFLSSIEICVLAHTDVLMMQNWEHTTLLLSRLNRMPRETRDTDFSRVRHWLLDKQAPLRRQTIVMASVVQPELNSSFKHYCINTAGAWRVRQACTGGAVRSVVPRVRQLFHRIDAPSLDLVALGKARFDYFCDSLLPSLTLEGGRGGVLIYFASYFDYVRVRNLFKSRRLNYLQCCEYTAAGNVTRARQQFEKGNVEFLLFTERFHFYHRYHIRGVRSVLFYGLPTFPNFYSELLNWLPDGASAVVLFTAADRLALERCVGVQRAKSMFAAGKNVHMLV